MTPPEEDERRGVPSCSALERLDECPASWHASAGIIEPPAEPNSDTESGNRIHKWLETGAQEDWDAMSYDEQDTAERCEQQAAALVRERFGDVIPTDFHEIRLGLTPLGVAHEVVRGSKVKYVVTGKADRIYVSDDRVLIVDFKTGRGEQERAETNRQLRGLAVLAFKLWQPETVDVAIVQPWAGQPTRTYYTDIIYAASSQWLRNVLHRVDEATPADMRAGDWCKYCPARFKCPKLRQVALEQASGLSLATLPVDPKTARAALFARAMELPAETLAAYLRGRTVINYYLGAIEGAARQRIADGETIPGYEIHETKPRETISDVAVAWDALAAMGCQPREFTAACSMTKKDHGALVRKLTGLKGRALQARIDQALEGAITLGKSSKRLVAVGEAIEEEGE